MSENVSDLFDEFAVREARGESPDPVEYLDRAGDAEADLAELLDLFLEWAPARDADPAAVLMMNAWLAGEAPLLLCASTADSASTTSATRSWASSTSPWRSGRRFAGTSSAWSKDFSIRAVSIAVFSLSSRRGWARVSTVSSRGRAPRFRLW